MAKKCKRRFGVAYYHRGYQRFYVEENLTLEECRERFKELKVHMCMKDEITNITAFEAMKSYSVYDGWDDYRVQEV